LGFCLALVFARRYPARPYHAAHAEELMTESYDLHPSKIFWHSRRGMLELDLLLVPFAREAFEALSLEDKLLYRDFLVEEDQDLWAWLMKRAEPSEARFHPMIDQILAHKVAST